MLIQFAPLRLNVKLKEILYKKTDSKWQKLLFI